MKFKKIIFLSFCLLLVNTVFPQKIYSASNSAKNSTAKISADLSKAEHELEKDNRARILKKYLEQYNSPLAKHAEVFVKEADENDLDWRLLASIAGVESTFAQQLPENSYNAWGWGIYGDNIYYFKSYDDGIKTISKGLRENYINKWGAKDVYEIGRIYAASPTWADRVTYFMEEIEEFEKENPAESLSLSL